MKNIFRVTSMMAACMLGRTIAQEIEPSVLNEATAVANRSLPSVAKLAGAENARNLGFETAEQAANLTLGDPLPIFMVQLNDLRGYQSGTDPSTLLKQVNKVIFPVLAREQVRSSIVVQRKENSWQATDFGGSNVVKLLTRTREQSAKQSQLPLSSYFGVQVPALNAYFVGYRSPDRKIMLRSILEDPQLKLSPDKTVPAEEVFSDLARVSQRRNDLPM